ncbi:hypothetical protein KRX57_00300 [Weeksellaceae bacterium TAE3-ERU29]|nr:hypothetical protein [Weeksellaceae bacterium TAE3-ERU29]
MKKIVISIALLSLSMSYAQIGINKQSPKATLDIKAKTDNTTNDLEGLLIPRVSINKALQMSGNSEIKESTMIYVDDISDYTVTYPVTGEDEKVSSITEKGYYFWNGTKWVRSVGTAGELLKEEKEVKNGVTRRNVVLPMQDSEGNNRAGLFTSFESPNKLNQAEIDFSGYGVVINRYHNDINPSALVLEKTRGTIDNPEFVQSGDGVGQIFFRVGDPDKSFLINRNSAFFRNTIVEYENQNSFSSELAWGVRKKGDQGPYFAMFLNENGALGLGGEASNEKLYVRGIATYDNVVQFNTANNVSAFRVGNDAITYVRALISEGEGKVGTAISIQNNSKVSDTQVNRWTWFNAYDDHPTSQTEGYREGLVLWGYDKTGVSASSGPKMIITDNGNVGIGGGFIYKANNIPVDEKLVVDGNVKATKFIATTGEIFPDYVFENYYTGISTAKSDYKFPNLSEVESFVKTNGHLPGYVSAKKVKEAGQIDMTATQITNVEKIEELYLHTIEQEKKIEQQSKEIEELKSLVKQLINK